MKLSLRIMVLAVIACLLWSSSFVFVKLALQHAPPLTVAGWRFVLAGVLLLPCCGDPRRMVRTVAAHWRLVLAVSFFSTILLYVLFFYGMTLVRGAQAAIVVGSAPLSAALLAHALRPDDRLTPRKFLAIALGIAGIVLVALAAHPWQAAGLREVGGMALLVCSEISFVLGNLLVLGRMRADVPPLVLNSAQMGIGGAVLLLLAQVVEGPVQVPATPVFLGSLTAMAVISAVAFTLWFHLLQTVKVSALNIWKFLIPVFGAVLSWTLLPGESPDLLSLGGMVVIGGAILLFHREAPVRGVTTEDAPTLFG